MPSEISAETIRTVRRSYGRCLIHEAFLKDFYETFFKSSPKIPPMFAHTDMEKQKRLLADGLNFLLMFAAGNPLANAKMEQLAELHSSRGNQVNPGLYPYWVDSLMRAARQYDPEWTLEIEKDWRRVLKKGIDFMTERF